MSGADHEHVFGMVLPDEAKLVAEHRDDLLGGITLIKGEVQLAVKDETGNTAARVRLARVAAHLPDGVSHFSMAFFQNGQR